MSPYRLIWFQHLHKAAGTYVVSRARNNFEVFWPQHTNANPQENGEFIPLWNMGKEELTRFVDRCEEQGVTFIACEWGGADFEALAHDSRVFLLTCLRHPLERLISNYNFDYYHVDFGWMTYESKNYQDYITNGVLHCSSNYYTRIFSRQNDPSSPLTEEHFELAKKNLELFHLILVAERGKKELLKLGWVKEADDYNRGYGDGEVYQVLLRKLRWLRAWQYYKKVRFLPPKNLNLGKINGRDFEIYNSIVKQQGIDIDRIF